MTVKQPHSWNSAKVTPKDTTTSTILMLRGQKLLIGPWRWFSSTRILGALLVTCWTYLTSYMMLIADSAVWRWRRHWQIVCRCSTVPLMNCVNCSLLTVLFVMRSTQVCRQQKEQRSPYLLELSLKGTYVTYPYLGYQYDRVRYLTTTKTNTEFLRILLLVA